MKTRQYMRFSFRCSSKFLLRVSSVEQISVSVLLGRVGACPSTWVNFAGSTCPSFKHLLLKVPQTLARNDSIDMDIQVVLPQMNTQMDSFVTFLPMLSQNFSDLVSAPVPSFKQFSIEGAVRPISCKVHFQVIIDFIQSLTSIYPVLKGSTNISQKHCLVSRRNIQCD